MLLSMEKVADVFLLLHRSRRAARNGNVVAVETALTRVPLSSAGRIVGRIVAF